MEIRAITPKRPIVNVPRVHRALHEEMYRFIIKLEGKFKDYPAQRPTTSGYQRSGALKHSYHHEVTARPGLIIGRLGSDPRVLTGTLHYRKTKRGRRGKGYYPKRGYAPYVMGKKQSREMKRRGWKKVGDILKKEWPGQVRRFQRAVNRAR